MGGKAITTITGKLSKDPEMFYTSQGIAFCKLSIPTESWNGKSNDTTWWNITIWRERAETMAKWTKKGTTLCVTGEVLQRKYTDKDGVERLSIDVKVIDSTIIEGMKSKSEAEGPSSTEPLTPPEFDQQEASARDMAASMRGEAPF